MAIIGTTVRGFSSEREPPFLGGVATCFLCACAVFCASCSRCSFSSDADWTLYEMLPANEKKMAAWLRKLLRLLKKKKILWCWQNHKQWFLNPILLSKLRQRIHDNCKFCVRNCDVFLWRQHLILILPYSCRTGQIPNNQGQKSFLRPNHPARERNFVSNGHFISFLTQTSSLRQNSATRKGHASGRQLGRGGCMVQQYFQQTLYTPSRNLGQHIPPLTSFPFPRHTGWWPNSLGQFDSTRQFSLILPGAGGYRYCKTPWEESGRTPPDNATTALTLVASFTAKRHHDECE